MKRISSIRKTWALMTALSCCLSVLPMKVYAENETPVPEETVVETADPAETAVPEETGDAPVLTQEPESQEQVSEGNEEEPSETGETPTRSTGTQIEGTQIYWDYDSTSKTLTISGNGAMPDFAGFTAAPWYGLDIKGLVIAEGVTSVGDYSFRGHMFGSSVNVNQRWFSSVQLPESLVRIGEHAFYHCSFTSLTIPANVAELGAYAFEENSNCLSVYINSNNITHIPQECFSGLTKLRYIKIPASVKTVGIGAFYYSGDVNNGTEVDIADVAAWCDIDFDESVYEQNQITYSNILDSQYENQFAYLSLNGQKITHLVIPEGVEEIKPYVFGGCKDITSITFPTTLKTIGKRNFGRLPNIDNIYISDIGKWAQVESHDNLGFPTSAFNVRRHDLYLNKSPNLHCVGEMNE